MTRCAPSGLARFHTNDPVNSQTTGGELYFALQQVLGQIVSNASKSTNVHTDSGSLVLIVNFSGSNDARIAEYPYRIDSSRCIVGSGPKADWVVNNADLQPEHAELVRIPCGAYIRALDAPKDGLIVNGQPVDESWIHSGDSLTLGKMELCVKGIGEIEFGSCEKLESLIIRTSESFEAMTGQARNVSEMPHIDRAPVMDFEMVDAGKPERTRNSDSPQGSKSKSDDNPWILFDSLVDVVEENQSIGSGHSEDSVEETLFRIPRIDVEPGDRLKTFDVDARVVQPVRISDENDCSDRFETSDPVPDSWSPAGVNDVITTPEQPDAIGNSGPDYYSEHPVSARNWKTTHSNEQASWLNELYDTIIPDEHDNSGTPINETGTDPEKISDLPETNDQRSADLFNRFDSIGHGAEPEMEANSAEPDLSILARSFETNSPDCDVSGTAECNSATSAAPPDITPVHSVAQVAEEMQPTSEVAFDFDNDTRQPSISRSSEEAESPPFPVPEREQKDDVHDYMSQLMQRLRGGASYREPAKIVETAKVNITPSQSPRTSSKNDPSDLAPENPLQANEFVSKSTLPEKPGSLLALRQIANQSVETAIQRSLQNKNQNSSTIFLAGSGFAFFLSVVLFIMSEGWFDLAFIAACISSIACAMSCFMFVSVNNGIERFLEYRKQIQENAAQTENKENQGN